MSHDSAKPERCRTLTAINRVELGHFKFSWFFGVQKKKIGRLSLFLRRDMPLRRSHIFPKAISFSLFPELEAVDDTC
jgi:hypothetical protein